MKASLFASKKYFKGPENEREMKLPHVEGLGRVVENKGRSDMKKK